MNLCDEHSILAFDGIKPGQIIPYCEDEHCDFAEPVPRCVCGSRKVAGICSFSLGMFSILAALLMFILVWRFH